MPQRKQDGSGSALPFAPHLLGLDSEQYLRFLPCRGLTVTMALCAINCTEQVQQSVFSE
jgi:hypothetical protein